MSEKQDWQWMGMGLKYILLPHMSLFCEVLQVQILLTFCEVRTMATTLLGKEKPSLLFLVDKDIQVWCCYCRKADVQFRKYFKNITECTRGRAHWQKKIFKLVFFSRQQGIVRLTAPYTQLMLPWQSIMAKISHLQHLPHNWQHQQ